MTESNKEKATLYGDIHSSSCKKLQGLIQQWNIELKLIDSGPNSSPLVFYKGDSIYGFEGIYSCFDKHGSPMFGYD